MVQSAFVIQRGLLPVKPGKNIFRQGRKEWPEKQSACLPAHDFMILLSWSLLILDDIIDEILLACQLVIC